MSSSASLQSSVPASVPAIDICGLGKRYAPSASRGGKEPVQALQGVSLSIQQGEFFALLGPNGAGKTTLIQCLGGLVRPTEGTASVMGHDILHDAVAARRSLGIVPQELVFDPFFTVRETLQIQSGYYSVGNNTEWIDHCLERLGLASKANTNLRALSGGMKRRVLVAQALVHRPPVIVLDEPTAGVDIDLRESLWDFMRSLNAEGHTIVLTTHYLEEVEALCGRTAFLRQGRLLEVCATADLVAEGGVSQAFRRRMAEAVN